MGVLRGPGQAAQDADPGPDGALPGRAKRTAGFGYPRRFAVTGLVLPANSGSKRKTGSPLRMTWREPSLLANLPKRISTSRSSLGLDQGSRTWTFAEHFGQAEAIPGSRAAAKAR
ncbi:hypothetical protein LAZ29_03135 [Cereibacter sphaeroides]|uniref:hypothetical protein n=1 Tax=Cereibacter sphaeroides TaxID=1063 RepID=UPI001F43191A|nr:hypothetical protein [Cereibacter sphaeroides]MCE6949919.1 hypothetical protein [Cereibacter sphaeroides]